MSSLLDIGSGLIHQDQSAPYQCFLSDAGLFLSGRASKGWSQFGEEGLIAAILERVGETTRWCFEVGAADGEFLSNTKALRDKGWHAVLIEADGVQFQKLEEAAYKNTHIFHSAVFGNDLNEILKSVGHEFDVGVIDIDAQDYWLWHYLNDPGPRVMCVEFGYYNDDDYLPAETRDPKYGDLAGLNKIVELGAAKGYVALAKTLCNVIFARGDCLCR